MCNKIRSSLYANPTYDWMVKDLGLSSSVSPAGELSSTEMKLWRMSSTSEKGIPEHIRTFQLFSSPSREIVTCISVNEESDLLVLGCKSGSIYYIQENILIHRHCSPVRFSTSLDGPVTGLHLLLSDDKSSFFLYALNASSTSCFLFPHRAHAAATCHTLDRSNGCRRHCSCLTDQNECIVARDNGLFRFRGLESIGCYAFDGVKQTIGSYKDCMLVCSEREGVQLVTIYNLKAHFIEYQGQMRRWTLPSSLMCSDGALEAAIDSFSEWGDIFILTRHHSVFCYHRLDLQSKLKVLYDHKLFELALTVAHSNDLYYGSIVEIHKLSCLS